MTDERRNGLPKTAHARLLREAIGGESEADDMRAMRLGCDRGCCEPLSICTRMRVGGYVQVPLLRVRPPIEQAAAHRSADPKCGGARPNGDHHDRALRLTVKASNVIASYKSKQERVCIAWTILLSRGFWSQAGNTIVPR